MIPRSVRARSPGTLQHAFDRSAQGRLREIADHAVPDTSASVDEKRLGNGGHAAILADDARCREDDWIRDVVLGKELADAAACVRIRCYADDDESVSCVVTIDALEARHLDAAGETPRRPEVHEYDAAAQRLEREAVAIQRRQCEARCRPVSAPESERRPRLRYRPVPEQHGEDCEQHDVDGDDDRAPERNSRAGAAPRGWAPGRPTVVDAGA